MFPDTTRATTAALLLILAATFAELFDSTGLGSLHLEARGKLLCANDHARGLLLAGDALYDDRRLHAARTESWWAST